MFGIPEDVLGFILKGLASAVLTLVIYMLKENISLIKKLSQTMTEFQQDFAVHKQADTNTKGEVEDLHADVKDLQKGQASTNLRVNTIETILKIQDHAKQS